MRVDLRHRPWVSTSRGLYRYDPRTRNLRRHGIRDGSGSQEFVDHALAKAWVLQHALLRALLASIAWSSVRKKARGLL